MLIELGAIIRYQITDAEKACFAAQNIDHTMRVTAQTATSTYITRDVRERQLTDTASISKINSDIKASRRHCCLIVAKIATD